MLSDQVRELEKDLEFKEKECQSLQKEVQQLRIKCKALKDCCKCVIPVKIYTHKARRNTTVKFMDDSCQTVTRIKGEKDCLETAIAYAVLKQLITKEDLNKLIKEREEH